MSDRRAYWTDELIDVVRNELGREVLLYMDDKDVYGVIAVIEDWLDENEPLSIKQRIRDYIDAGRQERGWGHDDDFDAGWDQCANHIETILGEK